MSQAIGISISTISHHFKKIGKVKKLNKWVSHELGENQRSSRFEVCLMLCLQISNDTFINRKVTSDEKWILYDKSKRLVQ